MSKESMSKDQEANFLINLLTYVSNNTNNLEKVIMVIGNAIEANNVIFSYSPMSEEEALDPNSGKFDVKLSTKVHNGVETICIARDGSEWTIICQLAFGIMAALTTSVRNNVMDYCSNENMLAYRRFIEIIKKSAISGTEAISYSNWDNNLEEN